MTIPISWKRLLPLTLPHLPPFCVLAGSCPCDPGILSGPAVGDQQWSGPGHTVFLRTQGSGSPHPPLCPLPAGGLRHCSMGVFPRPHPQPKGFVPQEQWGTVWVGPCVSPNCCCPPAQAGPMTGTSSGPLPLCMCPGRSSDALCQWVIDVFCSHTVSHLASSSF